MKSLLAEIFANSLNRPVVNILFLKVSISQLASPC